MIFGFDSCDILLALLLGVLLDFLFGDPRFALHPVRLMGRLAAALEKHLRKPEDPPARQTAKGLLTHIITAGTSAGCAFALIWLAGLAGRLPRLAVMALLTWSTLSAKDLRDESMRVYRALRENDLPAARRAVSMIVGRDTDALSSEGVARAAVETIAENTSDGEIAPLFYLFVFGPVGGIYFKAVNTMDSMFGYKNEKYLHFGRIPAKLDDFFGLIPSRLTVLFMTAASLLCGYDAAGAWKAALRDGRKHESPNSALSEAACAGALHVQLAGPISYGGIRRMKPYLGDDLRPLETEDIRRANRLMYGTSLLAAAVFMLLRLLIYLYL